MSVETRLSKLSSNEKVFDESVSIYQEALDKFGYNHKLIFQKTRTNNRETTFNCITREKCPLQEKCLTNSILYKATLTSNQDNK